ncbi:hypothetical protein FMLHJGGC_00080 [Staphylococcus phage BSwM-KMM1]|nr:hypothetical protein FMLHJGGC_00080 [Pseudomonas phage BSwM KMM1]
MANSNLGNIQKMADKFMPLQVGNQARKQAKRNKKLNRGG